MKRFFIATAFLILAILFSGAEAAEEKGSINMEELTGGFDDSPSPDEEEGGDDLLEGFDDEPSASAEIKAEPPRNKSRLNIDGFFSVSAAYNYAQKKPSPGAADYRGLSRLKSKLFLEIEYKLSEKWKVFGTGSGFYDFAYALKGKDKYSDTVISSNEREAELGELYFLGTLSKSMDVKIGRQVVVWGKSENIRITDILNPLDNREPGMVDIEDLRLPLAMTKLDYYLGDWNLALIAIHENRLPKNPAQGSDFNLSTIQLPREEKPAGNEYAVSLDGIFSGWDISFYAAKVYDDKATFRLGLNPVLRHAEITMAGVAANVAKGSWLIKTELASLAGLEFANSADKKSRLDMLAGIEYQGFPNQSISFEMSRRTIGNFQSSMKNYPDYAEENEIQTAFRYSGDFLYDRLHLILLAMAVGDGGNGGGFQRASAGYDLSDPLRITAGFVNYQGGSNVYFSSIGNNDRIFLEAKYSF